MLSIGPCPPPCLLKQRLPSFLLPLPLLLPNFQLLSSLFHPFLHHPRLPPRHQPHLQSLAFSQAHQLQLRQSYPLLLCHPSPCFLEDQKLLVPRCSDLCYAQYRSDCRRTPEAHFLSPFLPLFFAFSHHSYQSFHCPPWRPVRPYAPPLLFPFPHSRPARTCLPSPPPLHRPSLRHSCPEDCCQSSLTFQFRCPLLCCPSPPCLGHPLGSGKRHQAHPHSLSDRKHPWRPPPDQDLSPPQSS